MLKVGITGGLGCGKSTAARLLERHGYRRLDSDQIVRDRVLGREDIREALRVRYPKVARNHEVLTPDVAAQFGFSAVRAETTAFAQVHRLDDYVENLLTHSSVIRVVDGGRETPETARVWFREALAPFFAAGEAEFTHEVKIHVLRRNPPAPLA